MNLKVYQIYFDDSQADRLNKNFIPYKNEECDIFFENSVIRKLIENNCHLDSDYFGVVSYQLEDKIGNLMKNGWKIPEIANHSDTRFNFDTFKSILEENKPDCMSFQRHVSHDPITFADNFHPNFSVFFAQIMEKIGIKYIKNTYKDVFYCNFFVAKSEIYEKYVKEMLIPAMEAMKNMEDLYKNSNYPKPLPDNLAQIFGFKHYPMHPFLCERMFSLFAHINSLKCLHY